MSLAALRPGLTVGRLRVHGGDEPLATRLAADRVLSTAELVPTDLSPAAVLVIRRLADPWPGRLDLRSVRADPGWQGRTRLALQSCAAQAERPWGRVVSAGCEAVLFADRAELLACLLTDAASGLLRERWWWQSLGMARPAAVELALYATPEAMPAVFTGLAERRLVAPVAAWLTPQAAAALIATLCAAYGLSAAARALGPHPAPTVSPSVTVDSSAPDPPWTRWLPAESAQLSALAVEQEALAGLAIVLARHPEAPRRAAVISQLVRWRAGRPTAPSVNRAVQGGPQPGRNAHLDQVRLGRQVAHPAERWSSGEEPIAARDRRPPSLLPGDGAVARAARSAALGETTPLAGSGLAADVSSQIIPDAPAASAWPPPGPVTSAEIVTELGGLFHLVHLAQRLGLYADFTTPGKPGITLGVWDFVTLVGRSLLGCTGRRRDPVWRLLADLQARPYARPPGLGFRPPRVWRARPEWLEPFFADAPWRYCRSDGRLVLRHPYGFVVVDGPTELGRELRRYRVGRVVPDRDRRPEQSGRTPRGRDRWVAHLAGFLRCRLAVALGVGPARAARLALCRPARVSVTACRVDVVSDLVDLPIEVRLAAVDRDPGFVPAAGRALYFHFR